MKLDLFINEVLYPRSRGFRGYLIALFLITIALAIRLELWPVDFGLQYVTFFPAVAVTTVIAGFRPGMFSMIIGVIFATFILTKPYWSISMTSMDNSLMSNLVFIIDGFVVCFSIESMHQFRRKYTRELDDSRQAHAESEQSRQNLKNIFDNVIDGIIVIGESGIIESCNNAASQIFGYAEAELVGNNVSMLMPAPDRMQHDTHLRNFTSRERSAIIGINRELFGLRKDGTTFPMELSVCEIAGKKRKFTGILRDITDRKAREQQITHIAHHDPLTGLPNRVLLSDRIQQVTAIAKRAGSKAALIFIDLDGFKPINDLHGHDIGDLILKEVASRLSHSLRESDTAARFGGDEFIVLLSSIESDLNATMVAERIHNAILRPYEILGNTLQMSSSIGIALYPAHGDNESALIKNADIAMYHAKVSKTGKIRMFDATMLEKGK